jgi:purine-binding chemotaxis protein CheW
MAMAMESTTARIAQAGKFLSFVLGDREFGLEILKVQEINGLMGITRAPRAPECLRGVIRLRGRSIPIVDLRRVLGMPAVADTERTCVVVVQAKPADRDVTLGVVVDEVCEVLSLVEGQIEAPPSGGDSLTEADLVTGLGRLPNKVVTLLDIDRVLSGPQLAAVVETEGREEKS